MARLAVRAMARNHQGQCVCAAARKNVPGQEHSLESRGVA
jgi:hypothetical protein